MSATDIETVALDAAIDDADHARLRARLSRLRDALDDAPDHYDAEVTMGGRHGLVFVTISSSHHWWNEGELGTTRIRVVLGIAGGLRTAEYRDEFGGFERDYAADLRVGIALRRVCERIREAR